MMVFSDASGDPGIGKGNKYLVFAMVIFPDTASAESTEEAIASLRSQGVYKGEFRFSDLREEPAIKDAFFSTIMPRNFIIRAIIIDTHNTKKYQNLSPPSLYELALSKLLDRVLEQGDLLEARIRIDGVVPPRTKRYLSVHKNKALIKEIEGRNSKEDNLIQLADMVAGAIASSRLPHLPDHDRWFNVLDFTEDEKDNLLSD